VGYNLTAETPYLILKNSWGKLWGEEGFYKLEIGPLLETNKGKCLIAGTPFNVLPILN
jgi:cysteine peptidase B